MMQAAFPSKYTAVINELKQKIRQARMQAVISVNVQMLAIYWEIGNTIVQQQSFEGWGKKIINTLAQELKIEFPEINGFSPRNLRYMRDFALAYPLFSIWQASPAKLESAEISPIQFGRRCLPN